MVQVNMHEAKTSLSRLVEMALRGDDVVIARAGDPVVRLVPFKPMGADRRVLGRDSGLVTVSDDFDSPLPEDLLREFEE